MSKYDPEYQKAYYQEHREEILGKRKKRHKEERERILQYQRDWYKKNSESHKAKVQERRITKYAGKCVVCGKATWGYSKSKPGSRFCGDHKKEQWEEKQGKRVFVKPKHSEEQRREWREAKRRERAKDKGVTEATPGGLETKRRSAAKMTQEKLEQSSYGGPAFSRLKHSVNRDRDEKSENPPAPRKWADS